MNSPYDEAFDRSIFVTGICKRVKLSDIIEHFTSQGEIESVDVCNNNKGICFIMYKTTESAKNAILNLNHTFLFGIVLSVKPYLKKNVETNNEGVSIPRKPMNRDITKEPTRRESTRTAKPVSVVYSNSSLLVNETIYPIPTGVYLMKFIYAMREAKSGYAKLISLITSQNLFGNSHAKEISESMACVNGFKKILSKKQINIENYDQMNVYVVGDGVFPLTALIFMLFFQNPNFKKFYSIDPLLCFDLNLLENETLSQKIVIVPTLSQSFKVPDISPSPINESSSSTGSIPINLSDKRMCLNIVIACHSHAPLQEFYSRLPDTYPKCCVSLPCCGKTWSLLDESLLLEEYDDYEIFSAKRKVYLYYSN